jgi:hypothetical protein
MTFYSNTFSSSSTPRTALFTWMNTILTANGWSAVETWTSGTTQFDVFLSPGEYNGVGTDFYFAWGNASSTTASMSTCLFEEWDASGKKALKYAPGVSLRGSQVVDSDKTVTDATGVSLDSSLLAPSVRSFKVPASTEYTLVADVTVDRVIVGHSTFGVDNTVHSFGVLYAGMYDTLVPVADDPVPLCIWNGSVFSGASDGASMVGVTREPLGSGTDVNNWGAGVSFEVGAAAAENTSHLYALGAGTSALYSVADPYRNPRAFPVFFGTARNTSSGTVPFHQKPRGVFQGLVGSCQSGGGVGDTLTTTGDNAEVRTFVCVNAAGYAGGTGGVFVRTS